MQIILMGFIFEEYLCLEAVYDLVFTSLFILTLFIDTLIQISCLIKFYGE